MTKNIYCIRHGLSLHNELYKKYGSATFSNLDYTDTMLLPEGKKQAMNLKNNWDEINSIELVVVSPLKRTLETATTIFENKKVPIIAIDLSREYPLGLHTCNKRSNKEELELLYPDVDFSNIKSNKDNLWNPNTIEDIEALNERIKIVKEYLHKRKEKNIAFVNHSSFIGQMKDNCIKYLDNGDEELKYCYPYKIII